MGWRSRIFRCLALSTLLLALCACTTNVSVEGSVPTPRVQQIPASIGVHYSDEFKYFVHKESLPEGGSYKIDLGDQNHEFFQNLLENVFASVEEVDEPPLDAALMDGLDGIIVPRIVKYGFLTPSISGLKFYSASIEYEITIINERGETLGHWRIVGYGKSEGGLFQTQEALGEATMLAIRDGGARIAIELGQQPPVRDWLNGLREAGGLAPVPAGGARE